MRKYLIGFIVGVVISASATAYADDIANLIGQQVEGQTPIYLNGTKLDDAVIIDSKSYAPVRTVSDAAGLEVFFTEGEIHLDATQSDPVVDPVVDPATEITEPTDSVEPSKPIRTIEQIQSEIDSKKADLYIMQKILSGIELKQKSETTPGKYDSTYQAHAASVALLESEIAALEAEKAALEAQQ